MTGRGPLASSESASPGERICSSLNPKFCRAILAKEKPLSLGLSRSPATGTTTARSKNICQEEMAVMKESPFLKVRRLKDCIEEANISTTRVRWKYKNAFKRCTA